MFLNVLFVRSLILADDDELVSPSRDGFEATLAKLCGWLFTAMDMCQVTSKRFSHTRPVIQGE